MIMKWGRKFIYGIWVTIGFFVMLLADKITGDQFIDGVIYLSGMLILGNAAVHGANAWKNREVTKNAT